MTQERELLRDIRLGLEHSELRPVYGVAADRRRVPKKQGLLEDLGTVSSRDNLGQAVIMRLLTPRGELAALAHPEYGSRVHELIGRENTETTRNLLKLHILEALQLEPRIAETEVVSVEPHSHIRNLVTVLLKVKPSDGTGTVTIGPITLEFEP